MEQKKEKNILLIIMGVLIVLLLVARFATIQEFTVTAILQILTLVLVTLYCFWFYKKPHGNILKYTMLLFAFSNIICGSFYLATIDTYLDVVRIVASSAVCYCAGRLDRIDQNKILFPIISLAYLCASIAGLILYPSTDVLVVFGYFNFTITFITLMLAYFLRYKQHREAGLEDAPKK